MKKTIVLIVAIFFTTSSFFAQTSPNVILSEKTARTDFKHFLFTNEGLSYWLIAERGGFALQRVDSTISKIEKASIRLPNERGQYSHEKLWEIVPLKNSIGVFYLAFNKKTKNAAVKCLEFNKINFTESPKITKIKEFDDCDYGITSISFRITKSDDDSKILIAYRHRKSKKDGAEFHLDVKNSEWETIWKTRVKEKALQSEGFWSNLDAPTYYYRTSDFGNPQRFFVSYLSNGGKVILQMKKNIDNGRQTSFLVYSKESEGNHVEFTPDHGEASNLAQIDDVYLKGDELIIGGVYKKEENYTNTYIGYYGFGFNIEKEEISWGVGAAFEPSFLLSGLWSTVDKQKLDEKTGTTNVDFIPDFHSVYSNEDYILVFLSEYVGKYSTRGNFIVYRYSKSTGKLVNKFKIPHYCSLGTFNSGMTNSHVYLFFDDENNLYNYETHEPAEKRHGDKLKGLIKIPFEGSGKEYSRNLLWYEKSLGEQGKMYSQFNENGFYFYLLDTRSKEQIGHINLR